ncbi:hypothetical protein, partial [Pseudomonas syringae]|uniref:hypothetical protein n=1 Tax=Pseudomonas syringae TaxID=317 RepID=UPI001C814E46
MEILLSKSSSMLTSKPIALFTRLDIDLTPQWILNHVTANAGCKKPLRANAIYNVQYKNYNSRKMAKNNDKT